MDWLLLRTTGVALLAFCVYSGAALYTNNEISKKQEEIDSNKAAINGWITEAKTDTTNINGESNKYETMKLNLQELVNFDIQNFLSKLMFTMPENVKVTSIDVDDAGSVIMNAESGQYAQLGYFVSRLKLDNVLSNVDMNVVSMSNNIKIKVSGELP